MSASALQNIVNDVILAITCSVMVNVTLYPWRHKRSIMNKIQNPRSLIRVPSINMVKRYMDLIFNLILNTLQTESVMLLASYLQVTKSGLPFVSSSLFGGMFAAAFTGGSYRQHMLHWGFVFFYVESSPSGSAAYLSVIVQGAIIKPIYNAIQSEGLFKLSTYINMVKNPRTILTKYQSVFRKLTSISWTGCIDEIKRSVANMSFVEMCILLENFKQMKPGPKRPVRPVAARRKM